MHSPHQPSSPAGDGAPSSEPSEPAQLGLPVSVAVQLAHSIVGLASSEALVIKGPLAVAAGLRPHRLSADVDVLVRPGAAEQFAAAVRARGWVERPEDDENDVFPHHSMTFYHPLWPIDIDVHWRFPGFSAEPDEVFSRLLRRSEVSAVAGVPVRHPDRIGTALVQLLHLLRSPWAPHVSEESAFIAGRVSEEEMAELIELGEQTGALAALRPFVEEHFPQIARRVEFPAPDADWIVRTANRTSASIRMVRLLTSPWRKKAAVLRDALHPSRAGLAATDLAAISSTASELRKLRWSRLTRFARSVPTVLKDTVTTMRELRRHE